MNSYLAYRDATLPIGERVRDLLGRMTLEEKAAQTAAPFGSAVDVHTPPDTGWGAAVAALCTLNLPPKEAAAAGNELQRKHIEETRLGIPVLLAEEALIGLKMRGATTFPDAIAQAATWNPDLIEQMSRSIGVQMARVGVRQALSPLADVARDPRWGRVEETYGEEPYLVGLMASAFVRGLQNAVPGVPHVATLKHFLGYGASDGGRNTEATHLGERVIREVYGLPFEMAVRVGARGIMPSYSAVDGVPVSGSKTYLTDLLRHEYGFNGVVISDLNAVWQLQTKHGVAPNRGHAFAQAVKAGMDLDLDNAVSTEVMVAAVRAGLLSENELDRAVASVLRTKFLLGLFEEPYVDVESVPESLDPDSDRALARTIAEQGTVLLQNEPVDGSPVLPLRPGLKSIAVIGPNAHRPMGQLGNYSYQVLDSMTKRFAQAANPQARAEDAAELAGNTGADGAELLVDSVPIVTFLDAIRQRAGTDIDVVYERGCPIASPDRSGIAAAVEAARAAEIAILVVGDQSGINAFGTVGEGLDSTDLALPGVQRELVEAVVATGTPTVVVLSHGRPYVLGWMSESVPAIVSSFFGGEEAGTAVASILFGDVNPSGKLPIAFLRSAGAAPIPYWRTLQNTVYVDGSTGAVFALGHGLSYTTFEYSDLILESTEVPTDGVLRLSFAVSNTGSTAGAEVAQVYGQDVAGRTTRPGRTLLGFQRVHLAPGATERLTFEVPASRFALWDPAEQWVVEPGLIKVFVGGSSAATPLRDRVTLTGPEHHPGADRALLTSVTVGGPSLVGRVVPTDAGAAQESAALTGDSTVLEWLEHPAGGPALRSALSRLGEVDEDALAPALHLPLRQMIGYSQGRIPESVLDEVVNAVTPRPASVPSQTPLSAESTVAEWLDHPVGGAVLRAALGDHDEEVLTPALGSSLRQMVAYSQGRFPESLLDEMLSRIAAEGDRN